ncbi:LysR family transcriptional regulator [Xylophilus sp.]|uniref:LysR family transcriptional regulator n=1 Tax=Xylophilus sp. TaxID=2653893 RepID=UPI0013B981F7|nr:LysR family transcriptional regulator [Xylophilus sp.]KAF1048900.1 MAG: HTH-type transcriptional regulator DmlR [Xylophilus sp.]
MIRLDDLALFERAAALGSFSDAAREARLAPQQASAAVGRLERALDLRLFARSTRSLRLTAEGERYLPYAQEALAALREGRARLHGDGAQLSGLLRIAAPSDFGRHVLLPWLRDFHRAHPRLVLRLSFSDRIADVFRDPVDVAVRYGEPQDASFVALPLAPVNRRVLVAAPAYLAQRGRPAMLDDLAAHDCLPFLMRGRVYDRWVFIDADGQKRPVDVHGPLQSDDAEIVRRLAVAGEGIAYKSWLDVREDVLAGRLELLQGPWQGEPVPLSLVTAHRRQFLPAVQRLHALLRQRCDGLAPPTAG